MSPVAAKAQQSPHWPCARFTPVTAPFFRQSQELGCPESRCSFSSGNRLHARHTSLRACVGAGSPSAQLRLKELMKWRRNSRGVKSLTLFGAYTAWSEFALRRLMRLRD